MGIDKSNKSLKWDFSDIKVENKKHLESKFNAHEKLKKRISEISNEALLRLLEIKKTKI